MSRLVIISNRVPVRQRAAAGGLASALASALKEQHGLWFGWSGKVVAEQTPQVTETEMPDYTLATIDLSAENHDEYYNGYANGTLWPLCHYRTDLVDYHRSFGVGYNRVNRLFAEAIKPLLRPGDRIWVHDYHLIPCGEQLRRLGVAHRMGFFMHIPWPSAELLVTLPQHRALVQALFTYDLVGFQTPQDLRTFLTYVAHEAGGTVHEGGRVKLDGRMIQVGVFPIGIDSAVMGRMATAPEAKRHVARMLESLAGRRLIIGVDRLDYSKGIDNRFAAYGELLERYPEHRARVSMLQIASPSRIDVNQYQEMRGRLERQAGEINGRFADYDWVPLRYVNRAYPHSALAGLYRSACAALVTPLRDGMNLVAKEYLAAQDPANPGVLILSRFAGAAYQLKQALVVNPYDQESMVDALRRALHMSREERYERWTDLMQSVEEQSIQWWRDSFLTALLAAPVDPQAHLQSNVYH